MVICFFFFFSSRRRHTRFKCDWSSDVCSSDLCGVALELRQAAATAESVLVAFVDQLSSLGVIEVHGHAADRVLAGTGSAGSVLHIPLMCAWLVGIFAGCNPTKKNAPTGVRVP